MEKIRNDCEDCVEELVNYLQSQKMDSGDVGTLVQIFLENLKGDFLTESFPYQELADNSGIGKVVILDEEVIKILERLRECLNRK
ncbi:MAG: hypothetical protein KAV41_02995 [Candidatus Pacebacteria bacterium]|nr:hypothetical protein [Candidatus Paceibacterota bacterium]